jgi:hypothetical protein
MRTSPIRFLSLLAVVLLASAVASASAGAAQRFASPAGGGNCSSPAAACDLKTAIEGAQDGDEVIVAGNAAYDLSQPIASNAAISVHGAAGQSPPDVRSSAPLAFDFESPTATIAGLSLTASAANATALSFAGSLAERLRVQATGVTANAIELRGSATLRDSVVTGTFDGVKIDGDGSAAVRNVTAGGASGWAIDVESTGPALTPTIVNTIARDSGNPYGIWAAGNSTVTVSYSNYDQSFTTSTNAKVIDGGHNQHAAPLLDPTYAEELTGSPTIDAGLTDPANGAVDVDGNTRVVGFGTDIGASEQQPPAKLEPPGGTALPPVFGSATALLHPRFHVLAPRHHAKPHVVYGTKVRISLSSDARVRLALTHALGGRSVRRGGKVLCAAPAKSNRGHHRCTRWVNAGAFTVQVKQGTTLVGFSGRIGGHALAPGAYRMTLTAVDAHGLRSAPRTLAFRVLKG